MTILAVGDIQGCLAPLRLLLDALAFDPARDRLLLTGDLVNRGPHSLETLRFVRSLGESAVSVLGNHDLHLLARVHGERPRSRDTLDDIFAAPDRDELLDWLAALPLAYREPQSGTLLIHAGLPPQWTGDDALRRSAEVSAELRRDPQALFKAMYGDRPDTWRDDLEGMDRLRFIINALTRMRFCSAGGRIDLKQKGPPSSQGPGLLPWFDVPGRRSAGERIVFGHWSTLGQGLGAQREALGEVLCLDSGCVWGGCLTAVNLRTGEITRADCGEFRRADGVED